MLAEPAHRDICIPREKFLRGVFLAAEFCTVDRTRSDREYGGHGGPAIVGQIPHSTFCMIIRVNGCICNKAGTNIHDQRWDCGWRCHRNEGKRQGRSESKEGRKVGENVMINPRGRVYHLREEKKRQRVITSHQCLAIDPVSGLPNNCHGVFIGWKLSLDCPRALAGPS